MEECNVNVLVPNVTWWIDDPERLDCHLHTWHQHLNWKNGSGMLGQGWQLSRVCDLVKKTLKRHTVLEQTAIECPPSRSLIAIAIDCNCFLSLREHKKTPWRQIFIYNIFWMHTCKSYSNMHWCIIYSADTRKNAYTCIQNKTQTHAHTHTDTHTHTHQTQKEHLYRHYMLTNCVQESVKHRSYVHSLGWAPEVWMRLGKNEKHTCNICNFGLLFSLPQERIRRGMNCMEHPSKGTNDNAVWCPLWLH